MFLYSTSARTMVDNLDGNPRSPIKAYRKFVDMEACKRKKGSFFAS